MLRPVAIDPAHESLAPAPSSLARLSAYTRAVPAHRSRGARHIRTGNRADAGAGPHPFEWPTGATRLGAAWVPATASVPRDLGIQRLASVAGEDSDAPSATLGLLTPHPSLTTWPRPTMTPEGGFVSCCSRATTGAKPGTIPWRRGAPGNVLPKRRCSRGSTASMTWPASSSCGWLIWTRCGPAMSSAHADRAETLRAEMRL